MRERFWREMWGPPRGRYIGVSQALAGLATIAAALFGGTPSRIPLLFFAAMWLLSGVANCLPPGSRLTGWLRIAGLFGGLVYLVLTAYFFLRLVVRA